MAIPTEEAGEVRGFDAMAKMEGLSEKEEQLLTKAMAPYIRNAIDVVAPHIKNAITVMQPHISGSIADAMELMNKIDQLHMVANILGFDADAALAEAENISVSSGIPLSDAIDEVIRKRSESSYGPERIP